MRLALGKMLGRFKRRRDVGEDTRRLPSLVRAMATLVPRSVMREVVASSHDRRQWGVLAAAWVGVSEREFMSAAARELGMPYQDRVVTPDLTVFGDQARSMLGALRRTGVAVQLRGDCVVGFVAADPAEVRGLDFYDGTQNVSIAPWTEIAKALDSAERIVAESETNADQAEALRRRELSERIVEILVREASHHGARSLEILSADGKNRYQFTTPEGKVAVGNIHEEALRSVLLYLSTLTGGCMSLKDVGKVLVRAIGSSSNLRLSWGSQEQRQKELSFAPLGEASSKSEEIALADGSSTGVPVEKERAGTSVSHEISVPILVVDDNPMFCRVLERLLVREGFAVSFAENGEDALDRIAGLLGLLPKVIICDLHMPKMNGSEFIQSLKKSPRLQNIPVIMLTSDDGVEAEISMLELGADALISKSKDPRVLCAHVARLAKSHVLKEAA